MNKENKNLVGIIIVIIIIVAGVSFIAFASQNTPATENQDIVEKVQDISGQDPEKMKEEILPKENDFESIIAKAPSIELKDVSQSGASGTAWLAVYNGKTYHRVIAKNMPPLPGTDFYEGWLVKNPATGEFVSSLKMDYNPVTREARLDFVIDGDKSDYRRVVITSEPDDGNPAPDKHIIDGKFDANVTLTISSDAATQNNAPVIQSNTQDTTTPVASTSPAAAGTYEAYSADKIARAADGTVVLFFHAAWCPSCRALNSNIESNRSSIPARVYILKTDYDSETELRQKYGVTTQHTLVQVDKDGNLIRKWSGGSTLDSIISQIN